MEHELSSGRLVDRYEIVRLIGKGGMARVYLVRHATLGTLHALKLLTSASPNIRGRLIQEGRIQGQLRDPGIVNVTDVIVVDGAPGLVMEYVDGPTLSDWIRHRPPTLPQADALAREILRAMAAAHRAGLIHRDLKPANILIGIGHSGLQPQIADFGLAKAFATDAAPSLTRSGTMMGTPQYMAPEQIRDASTVDARADVFSLGAILYELVSGGELFTGADVVEVFAAIDASESIDLRARLPDLPPRMVETIAGCLRRHPADRWSDAGAVLQAWTQGAEQPLLRSWSDADREEARSIRSTPPEDGRPTGHLPALSAPAAGSPQATLSLSRLSDPPDSLARSAASSAPAVDAAPTYDASNPTVSSAPQTLVRTRPQARSWGWLAGAAILTLALGGGIWWSRQPEPAGPGVVIVSDDPAVQARLEQAWALIHAGDERRAHTLAKEVVAAEPESAWAQFTLAWDRSAPEAERDRARRLADPATPEGRLILLDEATRVGRASQAEWDAFLEENPSFTLATFLRVRDPTLSPEERVRLLEAANEAMPDSVLPLTALYNEARARFDKDEAARWVSEAERRFPLSPEVLWRVALVAHDQGDFARQRDAARRGLELAPDDQQLRRQLVIALLQVHDDEAATTEMERLFASGPDLGRARSMASLAHYAFGLGKLHLTRDLIARCRALTASTDGADVRPDCDEAAVMLAFNHLDPEWIRQEFETYLRNIADPAVSEARRLQSTATVLFVTGVLQVSERDFAGAEATAARLAALPADGSAGDGDAHRIEVQTNLAEARGVVNPEYLAYQEAYPALAIVDGMQGEHYDLAGFPEKALEEYRQVIAEVKPSGRSGIQLHTDASTAVRVAELVVDSNPSEAQAALDFFDKRWPTADPDHPLVLRAAAVRARLDTARTP